MTPPNDPFLPLRGWLLRVSVPLTLALATACGPAAPVPEAAGTPAGEAKPAKDEAPKKDQAGQQGRVASEKLVDRRSRTGLAADTLDQVKNHSPRPPKSSAEIYKAVAPATVIVRVGGGFGSGVIIDPEGWVLTNHHVIEEGAADDFKFKASVVMGKLSTATGAMERQEKEYEAYVYKSDKLRDIALLKLKDPPKNLPSVPIAPEKPVPGTEVTALGHAGAGMLWALKSGKISAMGKLSETLAQLASFADDEDGREMAKKFKEHVEDLNLGLIIQSTCNILPGDSGGPLLNERGELIGLNVFARRDRGTGGLLSFHVHRDELAKFAEAHPDHPAQLLPDPWDEGGGDAMYEDADLDGKVDMLMMAGRKPCSFCPPQSRAVFIDANQDSYHGRSELPDLDEVYDMRDFDAEITYLQSHRNAFIWYDTDDDGKHDVLLFDEGTNGLIDAGYTIDAEGVLTKNEEWSSGRPFQVERFGDSNLQKRIAQVTRAAFPSRYTDAPKGLAKTLPAAVPTTGHGLVRDLDRDGTRDGVTIESPFSERLLVDIDGNFAPSLPVTFGMKDVDRSKVDAEVAVVSQGQLMWVFYDTDDDGKHDLVFHAPGSRLYAAMEAFTLDENGKQTPAPQHVGRKLIRPHLMKNPAHANAMRAMVGKGLLDIMSAKDDDALQSFPHPVDDHRGTSMSFLEVKTAPKSVVAIVGYGSDGYLVDLDRNSRLFGKVEAQDVVSKGKFDAEVAYFQRNGMAWAFYDRDDDGAYDLVLVAPKISPATVTGAFTIKDGVATYDESFIAGPLIRPEVLSSARLKKQLEKLGPELFSPSML